MHHAWILSGPAGIGKRMVAVETAKILLDPQRLADADGLPRPNPSSTVSRAIDEGTHPDFRIIRKELAAESDDPEIRRRKLTNLPLDVLRQFLIGGMTGDGRFHEGAAMLSSAWGAGKAFIIDECELLDPTAQNALLKTLEEPPRDTWFFLVTSSPERLLPTVHSRCQHVRFSPLGPAEMLQWLSAAAAATDLGEDDRAQVLAFADGSPGLARVAMQEIPMAVRGAAKSAGKGAKAAKETESLPLHVIRRRLFRALDGLAAQRFEPTLGERFAEFVEAWAAARVREHRNASKDAANKEALGHLFRMLSQWTHEGLRSAVRHGRDAAVPLTILDRLLEAEREIAANVNPKLVLDALVLRIMQGAHRPEPVC